MRKFETNLFVFFIISFCTLNHLQAQSSKDFIALHDFQTIYLGDKVFLKDDPEEYVVTKIVDYDIYLSKTDHARRTSFITYGAHANKTLSFRKLDQQLEKVVESDYLQRRNKFKPYSLWRFESEGGEKSGVISFISKFADSLQVSYLDERGRYKGKIISSGQLISNKLPNPETHQDSLLFLTAALQWSSEEDLYSDDLSSLGHFIPNKGDAISLTPKVVENDNLAKWQVLAERGRKKKLEESKDRVQMAHKYHWQFKNGLLTIWMLGVSYKLKDSESKHYGSTEIVLKPIELNSSIAKFTVQKKSRTLFNEKKQQGNHSHRYNQDSVKINHPKYSYLRYGDLVSLKNDTSKYYVNALYGYTLGLINTANGKEKRIRQRKERNVHQEVDEIIEKNYSNHFSLKKKFPIHSKVVNDNGQDAYVKEYLFDKKLVKIARWENENLLSIESESIDNLVLKDNQFETYQDTLEIIHAIQNWRLDKILFKLHDPKTGELTIEKGEKIKFTHPLHADFSKKLDFGQELNMNYLTHKIMFNGTDIFIYSKGSSNFRGYWHLNKDILNIYLQGHSSSFKGEKNVEDFKRGKTKNCWVHKIQLKIDQISTNQISFVLEGHQSELVNPLVSEVFSHLSED